MPPKNSKKLPFEELKKLSLDEIKKLPIDQILELTDQEFEELMKLNAVGLNYHGVDLGNHVVYASCWYTCDSTSTGSSC